MSSRPALALAAALATVLLWASAFPLIGLALREFEPLALAAGRFAIGGALMLAWLLRARPPRPSRGNAARVLAMALVGIPLYQWFLNTGQTTVSAGAASFIANTSPVLTALLAVALARERFPAWAWAGTLLSFVGVALIASGQPGGLAFGAGATWVLGAAICQAVYFLVNKPLLQQQSPLAAAAMVVALGAALLLPWLPDAVAQARVASWQGLAAVVYLGIFPTCVGTFTWNVAQRQLGAARASNFLYLVPPAALALSFLLTGEVPALATWLGGAAAIAGVVLVNTRGR